MHWRTSRNAEKKGGLLRLFWMVAVGTLTGSVLATLYPEYTVWQNPVFRQGIGLNTMSFLHLTGCACLAIGILAALGLSMLGAAGAYAVVFCRGAAFGAVLTEVYRTQDIAGILTSLLFVVPFALMSILVLLPAARETCRGAGWLMRSVLGTEEDAFPLAGYALRFWILALLQFVLTASQYLLLHFGYPAFLHLMVN